MLIDHIDLRVSSLAKARPFYDPLLFAMGYSRLDEDEGAINYHLPTKDRSKAFFGLMVDPRHRPNGSRVAFRASSRDEVDRLAKVAKDAGASAFEPPEDYDGSPWYYATFFDDPDGNRLEICFRE